MKYGTKDGLEELHAKALQQFSIASETEKDQRQLAVEDLLFVNAEDGQWDEDAIEKRRDRPRYTINKTAGAIDQLVGDQRQNRVSITVEPQQDANKETAEVMTGLIRSIEQHSNASNAYDNGYTEQVTSGFGGWRILTEYSSEDSFDQDIKIKAINSAASSLFFDPQAEEYDCRDANYAFLITEISRKEFEKKYPDAIPSSVELEALNKRGGANWFNKDTVKVAEYWFKEPCKRRLGLLSDGRTIDLEEEKQVLDELQAMGVTVVKEREVDSHKVKMCKMSGSTFLEDPVEWAGKYIPLVPVFGKVAYIEGKKFVRGIVRLAKDPQRIFNYATSQVVESAALSPKNPIWITPAQASGHEQSLKTFNTKNSPFMLYNPDPQAPGPPQRGGAPEIQPALLQQIQQAGDDIYSTTGLEPSSMGRVPVLKSGKAIQAEQAMGDRGAFVFQDNLKKSISYTGIILVDLIPRIYDTERTVQVLGVDGKREEVEINKAEVNDINQPIIDQQTGEQVIVNDLSKGKYSVIAKAGPAFSTKRQQTVNQLLEFSADNPEFKLLIADILVDNMDINNSEELKKRVRVQMINQGVAKPTEEEVKELGLDQPQQPNPMDLALVENVKAQTEQMQVETQEIIAKVENLEAKTQEVIASTQEKTMKAMETMFKAFVAKKEALLLDEKDRDIVEAQQALVEEAQINTIAGGEIAGSMPAGIPPQVAMQQPMQEEMQEGEMQPTGEVPPMVNLPT